MTKGNPSKNAIKWVEVEEIDNAPVIIRHLSIGITTATVTVIKLIINLVHTKK
jgi:hypothetical protein